jgi:hypothetical protein
MSILDNAPLEDIVKKQLEFISKITGKALTKIDVNKSQFIKGMEKFDHQLKFSLDEKYTVEIKDSISYDNHYKIWSNDYTFDIINSDEHIYHEGWNSTTQIPDELEKVSESHLISEVSRNIKRVVGEIHPSTPESYNYNEYTFAEFKEERKYWANLYLIMYSLMKDEGKILPPRLIDQPLIKEYIEEGKITELDEITLSHISGLGNKFEQFAFNHMIFEREKILEQAAIKKTYLDPTIPISQKNLDIPFVKVPGDKYTDKINILVIEDWGDINKNNGSLGLLAEKLGADLARTGMYEGTTIYRTCTITDCLQLCNTGQINLIMMDKRGGNKLKEAMDALNEIGGSLNIKQGNEEVTPEQYDLKDEKEKWLEWIYSSLESKNLEKPPAIKISENFMNLDLSRKVRKMLPTDNKYNKFFAEEDKLIDKHVAEILEVNIIESELEAACRIDEMRKYDNIVFQTFQPARERLTKMELAKQLKLAETTKLLNKNISAEEFSDLFYACIEQNMPFDFEHTSPTVLVSGLQKLDLIMTKYQKYTDNEQLKWELYFTSSSKLDISATQLHDSGYFTQMNGNMKKLGNIVADSYLMIKKITEISNGEFLKFGSEDKETFPYRDTVEETIDQIIYSTISIAHTFSRDESRKNMSKFLIDYGQRIADVSNRTEKFKDVYKYMFK